MNIDQLRSFLEVANVGNFHRAAERLGTTQPTLSVRIKTLEERLGRQLFHRANNGVQLTRAGHRFRQYALIAVRAVEQGRAQVKLPDNITRSITIGLQNYLAHDLGPHLAQSLETDLPDMSICIELEYSETIVLHVADGLQDAGIVYVPTLVSELEVELIGHQDIVLVTTPELEFGSDEFRKGYIEVNWGEAFRSFQMEISATELTPHMSVDSPQIARDLLLRRGGAAYLDRKMLEPDPKTSGLRLCSEAPTFSRPVYFIRRPRQDEHPLGIVASIVREWFEAT